MSAKQSNTDLGDLQTKTSDPKEILQNMKRIFSNLPPQLSRSFEIEQDSFKQTNSFRILSWNVLAQALTGGDDNFVKCSPKTLSWKKRRLQILREIVDANADVICLQEVDFFSFLSATLEPLGYIGHFVPKPNSPALMFPGNFGSDGCALFFRREIFSEINEVQTVRLKLDNGENTNQVAIMAFLRHRKLDKDLVVGTTHLKSKCGFENTRKQQGKYLIKEFSNVSKETPVIITGDFNAASSEPVYRIMAQELSSVYPAASDKTLFTTCKIRGDSKGGEVTVVKVEDYIWYSETSLKMVQRLGVPSLDEIGPSLLPTEKYPSDHLSLSAEFIFK